MNQDKDMAIAIMQDVIKQMEKKIGELHTELFEMRSKALMYAQHAEELEGRVAEYEAPADEVEGK